MYWMFFSFLSQLSIASQWQVWGSLGLWMKVNLNRKPGRLWIGRYLQGDTMGYWTNVRHAQIRGWSKGDSTWVMIQALSGTVCIKEKEEDKGNSMSLIFFQTFHLQLLSHLWVSSLEFQNKDHVGNFNLGTKGLYIVVELWWGWGNHEGLKREKQRRPGVEGW